MEAKLFMKKLDQTELKHLVMERYKKLKLTSPLYISNNFLEQVFGQLWRSYVNCVTGFTMANL